MYGLLPPLQVVVSQSKMLVALRDQHWKDVRKIMSPVFSTAKMKKVRTRQKGREERWEKGKERGTTDRDGTEAKIE